jgi:hypothetical protein
MTGQFADEFLYNGESWNLAGVSGDELPIPVDFGMQTFSSCTACWRGFVMRYKIIDGMLIVDGMDLNTETPVAVNGVEPNHEKPGMFKFRYENLALKADFTGRIMIAKDFIRSMYVHMGFQTAESYRTVLEFEIVKGDVVKVTDLSEEMEKRRQTKSHKPAAPPRPPGGDFDEAAVGVWIEDRFSQDYE